MCSPEAFLGSILKAETIETIGLVSIFNRATPCIFDIRSGFWSGLATMAFFAPLPTEAFRLLPTLNSGLGSLRTDV